MTMFHAALRSFAILLLSSALMINALSPLETIFDVQRGSGPGSCDAHLDLLIKMFDEILQVNDNAVKQLQADNYNSNEETRKLAKSLFGVSPSKDGKEPGTGMNLDRLTKMRLWFGDLKREINPNNSPKPVSQIQLYCDSNFMDLKGLDDPSPVDPTKTVRDDMIESNQILQALNCWIYHVPTQNEAGGGAWLLLPKNDYPEFPKDAAGKHSYCNQADTYAWTLEADDQLRTQPMVILCPASFTKKNTYEAEIPDELDLAAQEDGKVLDMMEPRMLTLYHELFHVTQEPNKAGTETSPDAKYRPAKKGTDGKPVPSWPEKKAGFATELRQTYGAIECMYTALYDVADKPASHVRYMQATKNPESYAWFGVASYLSAVGSAHQDWSSGACRPQGSPAKTVTVVPGQNVPRQIGA